MSRKRQASRSVRKKTFNCYKRAGLARRISDFAALGYYLDGKQRPTFRYRFGGIDVEDYPVGVTDEATGVTRILRTLTFTTDEPRGNVAFRAASGKTITAAGEDTYVIDKTLRIRLGGNYKAEIIDTPAGKELRIPLDIAAGKLTLVLEYDW